ncbi:MAG: phosphoribosylanthranilate isomerase [Nitrososphaerales archaeon]
MAVRVKICGLTRKLDVEKAIDLGADALGFIFGYEASPRNLEFEKMKQLVRGVPPYVSTVVVSPSSNTKLEDVISIVQPTFLQLYDEHSSRNEPGLQNGRLRFSNVIQTVRPNQRDNMVKWALSLSRGCRGILLDASSTSLYANGTLGRKEGISDGKDEHWKLGKSLRGALDHFPLILGGGLDETNVADAIRAVNPFAVDVSSGVEAEPGIKDARRMKQFIQSAKNAVA